MPITELLERNARMYGNDIALVEVNPEITENRRVTWKEYNLIESAPESPYRREITWSVFNEKANRFANMLLERGVRKGDKVGILLMNCLEWLPIYFGILKTGALAVPLNFRYTADEIKYCLDLAEVDVLMFGPEFIGRVDEIVVFNDLDEDAFKKIAVLMLDEFKGPMQDKAISFNYTDEAVNFLAKKSVGGSRGARDLRNEIRRRVEDKIATKIIDSIDNPITSITVDVEEDEIVLR